jgi:arylsulfatase
VSDNGACPYDRNNIGQNKEPYQPDVAWSDSTGWAWARNSPFLFYKQNQFEGGIATPAIVHWPTGLKTQPGSLVHTPAHLVDILPTLADISNSSIPTSFPERTLTPLAGISLTPIFAGEQLSNRPPIHLLFSADRGLRDGDWKIVSFKRGPWELYNIRDDRAELHNVAEQHPEILSRMVKQWHATTANVLKAPAGEQAPVNDRIEAKAHREWSVYSRGANTSSRNNKDSPSTTPRRRNNQKDN